MSERILLRFLRHGLIDVSGDDTKLEKLTGTADDLAAILSATPTKAMAYALIAFDPEAPIDDPVVKEVMEVLAKRWATYANIFSGTPIGVIRPLILDALVRAAKGDDRISVAFAMAARNVLPFMNVGGEQEVWIDAVCEIEQQVDRCAEAEWATPASIEVDSLKLDAKATIEIGSNAKSVNQAMLAQKILAAASPHTAQGQPTNGNPHTPQQYQHWAADFSTRMAAAIAGVVEVSGNEVSGGIIDISKPLTALASAVSEHIDATLAAVSMATSGLQRRVDLLWWKESLFSPSARIRYRSLQPFTAAALMAFDVYRQVPTFSPASVASFLEEAVLAIPAAAEDNTVSIIDLAKQIRASVETGTLVAAASELASQPNGRGPILGFIGHPAMVTDDAAFRRLFGVQAETQLTAPAWAGWIFRELQAARATREAPSMRRRTGG